MSIVTFWNDDREQSGKTLTSVAVAVKMAIERNYKILLLSTSFDDPTMRNCFWEKEIQKNIKLFAGKNNTIAVEDGIEGISKLVNSNKLTPEVITDYTKVIFKGRLEVLGAFVGAPDKSYDENYLEYKELQNGYVDLIRNANLYYDMVIVDLDKRLNTKTKEEILKISNVNVYVFLQRLQSLNKYNELKKIDERISSPKAIPVIGNYFEQTKYNIKNITKYLGIKKQLHVIPFNLLYYEASEETNVVDLFLNARKLRDTTDENYIFMEQVSRLMNDIIKRVQELQKKMR